MKKFFRIFIFLFVFFIQNSFLYAEDHLAYKKLSDQGSTEGYTVYYFFSFSCQVCKKWSPLYEKQLENFDESIKFHYMPLSQTRGEQILAKAFLMTKNYALTNMMTKYFNFFEDAYFIREKDVKELVLSSLKEAGIEAKPWTETNLSFLERKVEKSKALFYSYGLHAIPTFVVLTPTGTYLFSNSKKVNASELLSKVHEFIQKDKA
jgi:protein-disulfide isomerase